MDDEKIVARSAEPESRGAASTTPLADSAVDGQGAPRRRTNGSAVAVAEGMGMGPGGGGAISLRNLRTLSSFQVPSFRLYFAAMVGQGFAMNMQMMAQSLLVYRVTGSAAALGVMALANSLPMLFFSLFGGVIADRIPKKNVFIAGQAGATVISLGVAFSLAFGYLGPAHPGSWWVLIVASLCQGTVWGLSMPARQTLVAEMVGEERLMNAVSLGMLEMNTLRLVAPALAGFLIDWIGFQAIYFAMAGLYVVAIGFILPLRVTGTMSLGGSGALSAMLDGFRYVRRETVLLMILGINFFIVLFSMPYMTLLPVITEDVLKVGAKGMGTLLSISGIGAMACSLVLASLPNKRRGAMMLVGTIIMGVALVGFALSDSWRLSLLLIVFVGLGQAARMSLGTTLIQYYVDPTYRGRVMSLMMMEFGLTSFGAFSTALVAQAIGVQWSIGGLAVMLVLMCVGVLAFMPRMRRLD